MIESEATRIRERTGADSIPVDPFFIATELGIEVLLATFPDDKTIEGVLRRDMRRPQILVRTTDPIARQKFTVAHELGHFVLHWKEKVPNMDDSNGLGNFIDRDSELYRGGQIQDDEFVKNRRSLEIQANLFAAALLMPFKDVRAFWGGERSTKALAKTFGVSEMAMKFRINELELW